MNCCTPSPSVTMPTYAWMANACKALLFCVATSIALVAIAAPEAGPGRGEGNSALEEGNTAYEYGDYERALALFTPLAKKGNAQAQAMLAQLYLGQPGVPRDEEQAVQWARLSAEQNDVSGLMVLSDIYLEGDGVTKDEVQAITYLRRAVELDSAEAKLRLGLMYLEGQGVERNPEQARQWIIAAAKQDFFAAQVILGRVVLNEGSKLGAGLPLGDEESPQADTPPVSAATRQAATAGDREAQLAVGRALYAKGLREGGDVVDALAWVEKAATSGHTMAQFAAGALYTDGSHGIPYDVTRALSWFAKGLKQLP